MSRLSETGCPRSLPLLLTDIQVSVHSADVKNVIRSYSIEISASNLHDLDEVSVAELSLSPFCLARC